MSLLTTGTRCILLPPCPILLPRRQGYVDVGDALVALAVGLRSPSYRAAAFLTLHLLVAAGAAFLGADLQGLVTPKAFLRLNYSLALDSPHGNPELVLRLKLPHHLVCPIQQEFLQRPVHLS